jgi:hypothetical protein
VCGSGVHNVATGLECPFQPGDRLTEVDGTEVSTNPMLAPSLILGACNTLVHLRMIRPAGYVVVEGSLPRRLYQEDKAILVMKGGAKACGIGVVVELNPVNSLFFVKRVIEGGSAWAAGVQQFDIILSVDGTALKGMSKDALPSLIVGPAGSSIVVSLLRAGKTDMGDVSHVRIRRSVETGRSQSCNAATTIRCHLVDSSKEEITFDVQGFFNAVAFDVSQALVTTMDRVDIPTQDFDGHSFILCILPASVCASDQRAVEELVELFLAQVANANSAMKHMAAAQNLESAHVDGFAIDQAAKTKGGDALAPTMRSSPMLMPMPPLSAFPLSPLFESAHELQEESQDSHSFGQQSLAKELSLEHQQDEEAYDDQQNRSFSLHTAPMPASWNDGSFQAMFSPSDGWAKLLVISEHECESQDAEGAAGHPPSRDAVDPYGVGTSKNEHYLQNSCPAADESVLTAKTVSAAAALKHADVGPRAPEHTEAVDVTVQCAGVSESVEDDNAEIHRLLDASLEESMEHNLDREIIELAQRLQVLAEGMPDAPGADLMRKAIYAAQKLQGQQPRERQALSATLVGAGAGAENQAKQPHERIPIIVQAVGSANAPQIERTTFLVPVYCTGEVLVQLMRKRTQLPQNARVILFCDDLILDRFCP